MITAGDSSSYCVNNALVGGVGYFVTGDFDGARDTTAGNVGGDGVKVVTE